MTRFFEARSSDAILACIVMAVESAACSPEPASSPPGPETTAIIPDSGSMQIGTGGSSSLPPPPPPPKKDGSATAPPPPPPSADAHAGGPCAAPGLLSCDDFEDMAVGAPPTGYVLESGGGSPGPIDVTDQVAHSGSHSVFVNGNTFSSEFTKKGSPIFPQASNTYYVRFWIRVSEEFASGHSAFMEAGPDSTDNTNEIRIGFHVNQLEVNRMPSDAEQLSNGGDYNNPSGGVHFAKETWNCLEVLFDGAKDELRVWVADKEIPELHVTDWNRGDIGWSPVYAAIRFGYEKYSGPDMQVWYDDVAIGTEKIGCGG